MNFVKGVAKGSRVAFAIVVANVLAFTCYAQEDAEESAKEAVLEQMGEGAAGDEGPIPMGAEPSAAVPNEKKIAQEILPSSTATYGDVAVIFNNGLLLTQSNPINFPTAQGPFLIRFTPNTPDANSYSVTSGPGAWDTSGESPVAGVGDDTTHDRALPFKFPFFGTIYTGLFINSNGHLTFEAGDTESRAFSGTQLLAKRRIAVAFTNLNALACSSGNPCSITFKSTPQVFAVTYNDVPRFGSVNRRYTSQARLYPNGVVELIYRSLPEGAGRSFNLGIGISAGRGPESGPAQKIDFAALAETNDSFNKTARHYFNIYTDADVPAGYGVTDQVGTLRVFHSQFEAGGDKFNHVQIFYDPLYVHYGTTPNSRGTFQNQGTKSLVLGIDRGVGSNLFFNNNDLYGGSTKLQSFQLLGNHQRWLWQWALLRDPLHWTTINIGDLTAVEMPGNWTWDELRLFGLTGSLDPGPSGVGIGVPGRLALLNNLTPQGVMAHEWAHINTARAGGIADLIDADGLHWSFWLNTQTDFGEDRSSVMQGNAWIEVGYDTEQCPGLEEFRTSEHQMPDGFSDLDLYFMGHRRPEEVPEPWYINNPTYTLEDCLGMTGQPSGPCSMPIEEVTRIYSEHHSEFVPETRSAKALVGMAGRTVCGTKQAVPMQTIQNAMRNTLNNIRNNPTGARAFILNQLGATSADCQAVDGVPIARPGNLAPLCAYARDELDKCYDPAGCLNHDGVLVGQGSWMLDVKTVAFVLIADPGKRPREVMAAAGHVDLLRSLFEEYVNEYVFSDEAYKVVDTSLDPLIH